MLKVTALLLHQSIPAIKFARVPCPAEFNTLTATILAPGATPVTAPLAATIPAT